tara:strand:- start:537 stop:1121 length:585 start_codon:yes stop_codon:yes gene_type:complete
MVKTSVKLPQGMTAFPRVSSREMVAKQRTASRNQMLGTLMLRQLGKRRNKKTEKKTESPELDPVKLGMDDMRRLFQNSVITPMLDRTPKPRHSHPFVIYLDVEEMARLGNLKLDVLRTGYPLGDIMNVPCWFSVSSRDPVAVRALHAARCRICWAMKFDENLTEVKDQETAKSLTLWETTNPWTVEWASSFFDD